MSFINAPQFLRIRRTRNHYTVTCCTGSHRSARRNKPADRDSLPSHPGHRKNSRSRARDSKAREISESVTSNDDLKSSPDVWNNSIDDQTSPATVIRRSSPEPSILTPKVESRVQNAARASKQPEPEQNASAVSKNPPKKKRGRPKGSKSMNQSSMPEPRISPFMLAIREDMRRRSIAANSDIMSGLFGSQSDESLKWDDIQLSAPNGLPDGDDNRDLLQELLPIIAEQENEANRVETEEEETMKQLVSTCYTQFNSIHRFSDRLANLKPYKLQEESEQECQACSGTGMTVCEYCKGEGYVDLGENGEKFDPKFGNNVFTMPKRVTGNIYHCPLCGGLQQERCTTCFGTGISGDGKDVEKDAGKDAAKRERAWKVFDMNELIEQEKDRIEIGLDGTIIMRAKRRGRPKKSRANVDKPNPQKRRGRKPKSTAKRDTPVGKLDGGWVEPAVETGNDADRRSDVHISTGDVSGSKAVEIAQSVIPLGPAVVVPPGRLMGHTTDFVNTTNYQVGRRLRRQAPKIGNDLQDSSEDSPDSSSPQNDQDGTEVLEDDLI